MKKNMDPSAPRRLILMRHAHAVAGSSNLEDWLRPLSSKGLAQAEEMATQLKKFSVLPDRALVSNALRTKQTWGAMEKAWQEKPQHILKKELYAATPEIILEVLENEFSLLKDNQNSLLLLGHNPGLEDTVNFLLKDKKIELRPASIVCLTSMQTSWYLTSLQKLSWELEHFIEATQSF